MPSYKESGVNFHSVGEFRDSIVKNLSFKGKRYARAASIGHYAGLVSFSDGYVALHTDGVGTKTILALKYGYFDEVGNDLIGMNVNDIVCIGAEPIAMVDYIATSIFDKKAGTRIGKSINDACREAGISMIGGETASVPDLITGIDISGTVVGFLKKGKEITGKKIREGDRIIGLRSNGFHSNGFSLIRKIYEKKEDKLEEKFDGLSLWKLLLRGTRIYSAMIMKILGEEELEIHGMAHITGGGVRNILRLKRMKYSINFPEIPELFNKVIEDGSIPMKEAFQVFNMGIGFVVVAPKRETDLIMERLSTFSPEIIGEVNQGSGLVIKNLGIRYRDYY